MECFIAFFRCMRQIRKILAAFGNHLRVSLCSLQLMIMTTFKLIKKFQFTLSTANGMLHCEERHTLLIKCFIVFLQSFLLFLLWIVRELILKTQHIAYRDQLPPWNHILLPGPLPPEIQMQEPLSTSSRTFPEVGEYKGKSVSTSLWTLDLYMSCRGAKYLCSLFGSYQIEILSLPHLCYYYTGSSKRSNVYAGHWLFRSSRDQRLQLGMDDDQYQLHVPYRRRVGLASVTQIQTHGYTIHMGIVWREMIPSWFQLLAQYKQFSTQTLEHNER